MSEAFAEAVPAQRPASASRSLLRDRSTMIRVLAGLAWLVAVTGLAAVTTSGRLVQVQHFAALTAEREGTPAAAFVILGLPIALTIAAGLLGQARQRSIWLLLVLVPALVMAVASGMVVPTVLAFVVLAPACWLGRAAVGRWLRPTPPLEAWVLGSALGLGVLALLTVMLGRVGQVRWYATVPITVLLAALAVFVDARVLRDDAARFRTWLMRADRMSWTDRFQLGLLIAVAWLSIVWACAPEIMPDAVRVRLPAAAYVAESGRLQSNPLWWNQVRTGASEQIFAFALTIGPIAVVKPIGLLAGWMAVAGVAALALRLGGRRALLPATATLATFPLYLWVFQSASADLFAVLYGLVAALIFVRSDLTRPRILLVGLFCLGIGLAVKASFATCLVGFMTAAVPIVLGRLGENRTRARIVAGLGLLSIGAALVLALPHLRLLARAMTELGFGGSDWITLVEQIDFLEQFGAGWSVSSLLTSPLDVTVHGRRYANSGDGVAGFLVLALVPLAIVAWPAGPTARLVLATSIAYLAWFWSGQVLRYGLPIVAVLAIVGGVALADFERIVRRWSTRGSLLAATTGTLVASLTVFGLVGYLLALLIFPGEIPWRVSLGLEPPAAYLARSPWEYRALRVLDDEPRVTRIATTYTDTAQMYSPAALNPVFSTGIGSRAGDFDEPTLLQYLDREGYSHILVYRDKILEGWDTVLAYDDGFLRRNTAFLGGARGVDVYRLLPAPERGPANTWAHGPELLQNGDLELASNGEPAGWVKVGSPVYDETGRWSRHGQRAFRGDPNGAYSISVPVTPNARYLLSQSTRGVRAGSLARLQINWQDAAGGLAGVSLQVVPVSEHRYHGWSMLATSPPNAASATVYLQAQRDEVWFDDASLRPVAAP